MKLQICVQILVVNGIVPPPLPPPRLCSVGVFHHYSHFKQDEYQLRDHVLMKHYKLRIDKIYIISNVEHTFALFTRTKQILHLITDNLLFSIVLLRPDAPVSRKPIKGVLGIRCYVRKLCVKVSRTRFPSSRAIIEVYLEINLFYIMYLCHSPIYFTLSRGGSSPPLVQMEEMILNFPYLYIKM